MKFACTLLVGCALLVAACGGGSDSPTAPSGQPPAGSIPFSTTDLRVGTGAEATTGKSVTVNYTLWLYNTAGTENKGSLVDSSLAPGRTPLTFPVGTTQLIPGFSQGVVGMRVGGLRRVILPPNLAYGSQGSGNTVPPNATLIFEIELLSVQ
jgi:FKBP-type peptidyl-prolyl cis-trans isomerase FkpA